MRSFSLTSNLTSTALSTRSIPFVDHSMPLVDSSSQASSVLKINDPFVTQSFVPNISVHIYSPIVSEYEASLYSEKPETYISRDNFVKLSPSSKKTYAKFSNRRESPRNQEAYCHDTVLNSKLDVGLHKYGEGIFRSDLNFFPNTSIYPSTYFTLRSKVVHPHSDDTTKNIKSRTAPKITEKESVSRHHSFQEGLKTPRITLRKSNSTLVRRYPPVCGRIPRPMTWKPTSTEKLKRSRYLHQKAYEPQNFSAYLPPSCTNAPHTFLPRVPHANHGNTLQRWRPRSYRQQQGYNNNGFKLVSNFRDLFYD